MSQPDKKISSKYFYDQRGSHLFEEICKLDEYYLTRTELQIMQQFADEMAKQLGPNVRLIEYGSGSSVKTQLLLDRLMLPATYVPVDISEDHLDTIVTQLRWQYPQIDIDPVAADFTEPFELPIRPQAIDHDAVYFPGSTIGNFEHGVAQDILQQMAQIIGTGGGLLIGIDLHKDPEVIELAYNDAQGVTAEFNKNLLVRINAELDANFDVESFRHHSTYNLEKQRIESSLVSEIEQEVNIQGHNFHFAPGEHLHTEYSHKYTIDGFAAFSARAGFQLHKYWTDSQRLFGVLHLVVL